MNSLRLFVFVLISLALPAWANGPLRSVIIFGNEKTERATIVGIMALEEQPYVTEELVREVDDRLTNSGLFKSVKVSRMENPDGTYDLRVTVVEKQLWFAFPIFQAWSGRYNGGAAFGESNILASNTRTLFLAQGGNSLTRFFGIVDAQNVFDSNFSVRSWVLIRRDEISLYSGTTDIGDIEMKDYAISAVPGYQWTHNIRTSFAINYRYVDYGVHPQVTLSGVTGHDVSLGFEFLYDSLKRRDGFLNGYRLKASYEFAETRFGADFKYHIQEVQGIYATRVGSFLNYVALLDGAIADDTLPFHKDLTLGGSSLRGYSDRQFRGDTRIMARQDLLFPAYRHRKFSIFGVVFHDLGLLYRDSVGIQSSSLRNGVGGGLRVSLAEILAPVFGLDFGYGVEDKDFHMYFALGLVDF